MNALLSSHEWPHLTEKLASGLAVAAGQSLLLFFVAAALAAALRKASAAGRHLVWLAAIGGSLALPILNSSLPQFHILPPLFLKKAALSSSPPNAGPSSFSIAADASRPSGARTTSPEAGSAREPVELLVSSTAVAAAWLLGVVLLSMRLVAAGIRLRGAARLPLVPAGAPLSEALEEAAREVALRPRVLLHLGPPRAMPMVWGLWRSRLLLPAGAENWEPARIRAVLLHECAHLQRRDPIALLLGEIVRILYWFNPLAWLALRRLEVEQEIAADDLVLQRGFRASDYAGYIMEIATSLICRPRALALSMAGADRLERRLHTILDASRSRSPLTSRRATLGIVTAATLTLPFAVLRAREQQATPPIPQKADSNPNEASQETREMRQKLATIVVPHIEFRDAALKDVLTFIKNKSMELDPDRKGINVVLKLRASSPLKPGVSAPEVEPAFPRVTLKLDNVQLKKLLETIADQARLELHIGPYAVSFEPPEQKEDPWVTREWRLPNDPPFATAPAKEQLVALGVTFPPGSALALVPGSESSELIIKNTKENLELIKAVMDATFTTSEWAVPPSLFKSTTSPTNELVAAGVGFPKGSLAEYKDGGKRLVARNTGENVVRIIEYVQHPKRFKLERKLDSIVIPTFELRNATTQQALETMQKKSVELDPEHTGVHFVLSNQKRANPPGGAKSDSPALSTAKPAAIPGLDPQSNPGATITVSMQNIPLSEVLIYVAALSNLQYDVNDEEVILLPFPEH